MYAVVVRGQAQDGKMEDLKNFIKNEAIPSLEVEGMISIGFCNPEENVNLGMVSLPIRRQLIALEKLEMRILQNYRIY